jgi:hypothetical protein
MRYERGTLFREAVQPRLMVVSGSTQAQRLEGLTHGDSAAEPQTLAIVFAAVDAELVTLSVRSWPRSDVERERGAYRPVIRDYRGITPRVEYVTS